MTTLFFDLANIVDDNPDWSDEDGLNDRLQKKYTRLDKYTSLDSKTNKFEWLRPPEDWKKSEA